MTTSNTITQNDFSAIFENIHMATFAYGRGEVGEIKAYGGSTIPAGWLLCDGQAVSRTTYSELFSVIGTTYGSGDGSTTFNLPDLRDRFPVGAGTTYAVGSTGGEATVTLDISKIPSHDGHALGNNYVSGVAAGETTYYLGANTVYGTDRPYIVKNGNELAMRSMSRGGGEAHNNMPPYMAINYIIYAKNTVTMANPSLDLFYPVGSYYETSDSTFDPNVQWGGTWVLETAGQVHVSSGTGYTINGALTNTTDGGASTVSLQTTNLPAHTHALFGNDYPGSSDPSSSSIINRYATSGYTDLPYSVRPTQTVTTANVGKSGSTGSGIAHNNMQPYIVVNRWHRTA